MKKFLTKLFAGLLSLTAVFGLAACNGENADTEKNSADDETTVALSSQVDKFMDFVRSGEYLKAVEYYNDKLYGNYQLEEEAAIGMADLLKSLQREILNGQKSESDAKKITGVVDIVLAQTDINIEKYDQLQAGINEAVASKAAFLAGKELESLKKYVEAISEYAIVCEYDSNYEEATEAIERCLNTAKKDALANAASLAGSGRYVEAISRLDELNSNLPNNDSDLEAKISVYTKAYISNTIDEASNSFVTPSTDYSTALNIINAALQHFPNDESLNEKKAYYQSFAPVNLYDMKTLKGKASKLTTDTDIYGNSYQKCFWSGYSSMIWNETDISYHLDKSYNTFQATIYARSNKNGVQNMIAEIYADGKIIYQNLQIPDNSTQPFTINLDVTGVKELRIVLNRNYGDIRSGIGMTNMIIQKTVK